jgi:hypothetical protein
MQSTTLVIGLTVSLCVAALAPAQTPTPTPVDSNVAVTSFAQSRGNPCPSRGGVGCGGCYPAPIPGSDPTSELPKVNPEWQPISPMIDLGSGTPADPSVPPASAPVVIQGTVSLSKVNTGGDFPGSHISDDQNTYITLDEADASRIASGNQSESWECPGENCNQIEMEWEISKYPLFAWAGEGDRVIAVGRWIFDCGHPDPDQGHCSVGTARACTSESDCSSSETCESGFCTAKCTADTECPTGATCVGGLGACTGSGARCITDVDCGSGNTCTNPAPNFNYRAELHPPQALAILRQNKFVSGGIPATRADVYVSADGGGAGDRCVVTHLASATDVLLSKACFPLISPLANANAPDFNHCSSTARHCATDTDCPAGETCIQMKNFEFDMPLPPQPTPGATLKTKIKKFGQKGGRAPKPTLQVVMSPTPYLHVVVPMATPLPNGKMPNVFAASISAGWKEDTTALKHVRVKFTGLTVNNPLKDRVPAFPKQCSSRTTYGLSGLSCASDRDCVSGTSCISPFVPGWALFGEVNGDWFQFKHLDTIGGEAPFSAPPYTVPATPLFIKQSKKIDEWVPATGSIHIATTGYSLNCLDRLYGGDVKGSLRKYGLGPGAVCLGAAPHDLGALDVTLNGPSFMPSTPAPSVTPSVVCTPAAGKTPATCFATSGEGGGGHCSPTSTSKLCVSDADCPGQCSGGAATGSRPCVTDADCKHCSLTTSQFCATDVDCPAGTCSGSSQRCRANVDCASGHTCDTSTLETCVADTGATCDGEETCNGTCSNNSAQSCHIDADCGPANTCVFGGTFTLSYTIQVE